jgi:mRNA interferase HigB
MHIISEKRLREYMRKHADAAKALVYLENLFAHATWNDINEVRQQRKDADLVEVNSGRTVQVFNVCKNDYRLVVHIHFNKQRVFIREFMTHNEYASGEWKKRN